MRVEKYRTQPLEMCTVHHWLINARARGWELERFVQSSQAYNFACSLPDPVGIAVILAAGSR